MKRAARVDYALAALIGILALLLYGRTMAPGLLGGDSGEFQFAAWLGGLVHPTGYPLYLLLGHAWGHLLPWGTPAWRLNLLSAIFGALAVALTFLLALRALNFAGPARQSPVYRLLALVAAATFAVGPTFWSQSVIAEVYPLQAALVAGLWLALLSWAAAPERDWPLYVAAALFGLGMVHHRVTVLLVPAGLLFVLQVAAAAGCPPRWGHRLARALPLAILPLLLYLYIPLRAPHSPYLKILLGPGQTLHLYEGTFGGFLTYLSGEAFAGAFRSGAGAVAQLGTAGRLFLANLTWAGVGLAIFGVVGLTSPRGRALLTLTGISFLAILVFNLFYGIGDIYVYYIPAYLICCLWIAFGVATLGSMAARLFESLREPSPPAGMRAGAARPALLALGMLGLALPLWLLASGYGAADQSQNRQDEAGWTARLAEDIPQGAVLVTNDRDEMMPLWYLQNVDGLRPDLIGLFPLILPGSAWSDVGRVAEQALQSGRPVYLTKPMPGIEVKFRLEPAGKLTRVLGPAVTRGPEREIQKDFAGAVHLLGYDVQPAHGIVTVTLYWQALRPLTENYTSFVHLQDHAGKMIGQDDHRPGGDYYPSSLWQPGDIIKDVHTINLDAASTDAGPYTILAGLYTRKSGIQNLGETQKLGEIR